MDGLNYNLILESADKHLFVGSRVVLNCVSFKERVKIMKTVSTVEIHMFTLKGTAKICRVYSSIKNGKNFLTFIGWNPFPCYSMETTWRVFVKWMTENGWEEAKGITRIVTIKEEN